MRAHVREKKHHVNKKRMTFFQRQCENPEIRNTSVEGWLSRYFVIDVPFPRSRFSQKERKRRKRRRREKREEERRREKKRQRDGRRRRKSVRSKREKEKKLSAGNSLSKSLGKQKLQALYQFQLFPSTFPFNFFSRGNCFCFPLSSLSLSRSYIRLKRILHHQKQQQ